MNNLALPVIHRTDDLPLHTRIMNSEISDHERFGAQFIVLDSGAGDCYVLYDETKHGDHDFNAFTRRVKEKWQVQEYYACSASLLRLLYDSDKDAHDKSLSHGESDSTRLFDSIVKDALDKKASDIHFERRDRITVVRMRIHGEMFDIRELDNNDGDRCVRVAMTLMGDDDSKATTFSRGEMQGGSVTRTVNGITVKLRGQTSPAYTIGGAGQDTVMRVLPMSGTFRYYQSLDDLGYLPEQRTLIDMARTAPRGVLICSGGTGSGKSTSLDCFLRMAIVESDGTGKFITVEDPPEFIIRGATQIPVRESFADAMRAAVRMDPDLLMVGETRDHESAILLEGMALAGHPVYTTIHTGYALGIYPRLAHLGVDPNVLASREFFSVMMCQRLLQTICTHCSTPYTETDDAKHSTDRFKRIRRITEAISGDAIDGIRVRGAGCPQCHNLGITGRTVCAEVVQPDYELLSHLRAGREDLAFKHWLQGSLRATSLGSAVIKMQHGIIDPFEFEKAFGAGSYLRDLSLCG